MQVSSINGTVLILISILTSTCLTFILKPMAVYAHNKLIPALSAANQGDAIKSSKKGGKDVNFVLVTKWI